MSDVENIEFLDLSDVDEMEKIRVKATLLQTQPCVQLSWQKHDKKLFGKSLTAKQCRQIEKKRAVSPRPVTSNNDYIYPIVPATSVVNNIYSEHHFHQAPVVISPPVSSYGGIQSNPLYYGKMLAAVSPPYPQQVSVIPKNVVNVIHKHPYGITTEPVHIQNKIADPYNVTSQYIIEQQSCESVTARPVVQQQHCANGQNREQESCIKSYSDVQATDVSESITVNQSSTEQIAPAVLISSSCEVDNDKNNAIKPTNNSSANKSWASLFSSKKSNNGVNYQSVEPGLGKCVIENAANKEININESLCPIKHPRKTQFIDPDCYRMGEYLTNYCVDGRAVSLQPRGLINQSNYCYINSILQALIACPPLYNLLSGLLQNISSSEKRKPTPVIDGMCRFIKEYRHLPANLRVNNRRSEGKVQKKDQGILINTDIPFEPLWIYRMLNGIRTDLIEGRQEDAEEFLGCLLNGMNDEMLELIKLVKTDCDQPGQNTNNTDTDTDQDKGWRVMGPKNKGSITRRTDFGKTPVSDIFGGFLKSRIHRTGDHITENIQPFFTLQLNIEKVKTVREALEALITKNQLEGLMSSKTNEEVEAWQQVMLDELPIILILHLKCFDFKLDGCTKIVKALEFPIDLKIDSKLLSSKTQTAKEKQYKLFAVVYHDGKEATKGHYITDTFHVGYSSWIRYDDASVKLVQEEHVLKPQGTRVPYLLFYRRSDTIKSK